MLKQLARLLGLLFIMGMSNLGHAQTIVPQSIIDLKSPVNDFVLENDLIYTAGSNGKLNCININTSAEIWSLTLPSIKDFMGDEIAPKLLAIDKLSGEETLLVATQGKSGYRNVYLIKDRKADKIIEDLREKWMISEVKFMNEKLMVISLISNEIILYDISKRKVVYKIQTGHSTLSDMCFNDDKSELAIADESGVVNIIHTISGKAVKQLKGANLDKVNQLSYRKGTIVTAGQDRRLGIYTIDTGQAAHLESEFLIFNTGLSPDCKYIVYTANEQHQMKVVELSSQKTLLILQGHKAIVTKIQFDTNTIISSAEDGLICIWDIAKIN